MSHSEENHLVVRVPGVSTVFGELAYFSQARVLCCANEKSLTVSVSPSSDNQVHIINKVTGDKKRFSINALKFRKEDKWGNYVKGVYQQFTEAGYSLKAFDFTLEGPLVNSDSSSLAAELSVAVALALRKLLALDVTDEEIAKLCYRSCTSYCGELAKYSTIMTVMVAEKGSFLLFDMGNLSYVHLDDPFDDECTILSVDCRIPPLAMREEVAHKHRKAREAMALLRSLAPQYSFRDFPLHEISDRVIPLDEETRRICYTILDECNAVSMMPRLFRSHDFAQIGRFYARISKMLRDDLELTCPEVDWLIKRASEIPQCYGAGLVYNGDSTYVALIIDTKSVPLYIAKLDDYERIFGFKATYHRFNPCGGYEFS